MARRIEMNARNGCLILLYALVCLFVIACKEEPAGVQSVTPTTENPSPMPDDNHTDTLDVYVVESFEDIERLTPLSEIPGTLRVNPSEELSDVSLPNLEAVAGDVVISNAKDLQRIDLGALLTIGGNLVVEESSSLTDVGMASLGTVGGDVRVVENNALQNVDLNALGTVGGDVRVESNDALTDVGMSALGTVGGDVRIGKNSELKNIDLNALGTVGGDVRIGRNSELKNIDLNALGTVGGDVRVESNVALANIGASALGTVGGGVRIGENNALGELRLSQLKQVGGDLSNRFSGLELMQGDLVVDNNASLKRVVFPRLQKVTGKLVFKTLPQLMSLSLSSLGAGSDESSSPTEIEVADNDALELLDLWSLKSTREGILIKNNIKLSVIQIRSLEEVGNDLELTQLDSLEELDLPRLSRVFGAWIVVNNSLLARIFVPSLTKVGVGSRIADNPKLSPCTEDSIIHDLQEGSEIEFTNNGPGAGSTGESCGPCALDHLVCDDEGELVCSGETQCPTVKFEVDEPTDIESDRAVLTAKFIERPLEDISDYGFCINRDEELSKCIGLGTLEAPQFGEHLHEVPFEPLSLRDLLPGREYRVNAYAQIADGPRIDSDEIVFTTLAPVPDQFDASQGTSTGYVELSWKYVDGAVEYVVSRDGDEIERIHGWDEGFPDVGAGAPPVPGEPENVHAVGTDEEIVLNWDAPDVVRGASHQYTIRAVYPDAESDESAERIGYRAAYEITDYQVKIGEKDWKPVGTDTFYTDEAAPASTITKPEISASSGEFAEHVSLQIMTAPSVESNEVTYHVRARYSDESSVLNTASVEVSASRTSGELTYQWEVKNSFGNFVEIPGAITASYDHVDAPEDGSPREYRLKVSASGTEPVYSDPVVGYRAVAGKVTTRSVIDTTATSALLRGRVDGFGLPESTDFGVCYVKVSDHTGQSQDEHCEPVSTTGSSGNFGVTVSGLSPDTQYTVRAYISNNEVKSHGAELPFQTLPTDHPCAAASSDVFVSGNGDDVPFGICMVAHLETIANDTSLWDKNFELLRSISLASVDLARIGNVTAPFTGVFDGGGFRLDDMKITVQSTQHVGLFGVLAGEVKNLTFTNVNIDAQGSLYVGTLAGEVKDGSLIASVAVGPGEVKGMHWVGGLAGYVGSSELSVVGADVIVSGSNQVGGLVGEGMNLEIVSSYFLGAVTGDSDVGGLVGTQTEGIIKYSYVDADIHGGTENVGGFVGKLGDVKIELSHARGYLYGVESAGGMVGFAYGGDAIIYQSYALGSVDGENNIGGLVGKLSDKSSIEQSYAAGHISGDVGVGGLVGYVGGASSVKNTYAVGNVTATTDFAGGLVGNFHSGTLDESFATGGVFAPPQNNSGWLVGARASVAVVSKSYENADAICKNCAHTFGEQLSYSDMMDQAKHEDSFEDLDFISVWKSVGYGAPRLQWESVLLNCNPLSDHFEQNGGDGTFESPYTICSEQQFNKIGDDYPNAHFVLLEELDFSGVEVTMIGSKTVPFNGVFDGNHKLIKNLETLNTDTEDYVGLFRIIADAAQIRNVKLGNINISGNDNVGGLAGYSDGALVVDCAVNGGTVNGVSSVGGLIGAVEFDGKVVNGVSTAIVVASGNDVGGLIGYLENAIVLGGFTASDVTGNENVGGFVGWMQDATIVGGTANSGKTTVGVSGVGGFVGVVVDGILKGELKSLGWVEGDSSVGGLVGYFERGSISMAHSTAEVDGTGDAVGGLVGWMIDGELTESNVQGNITGDSSVGGLVGYLEKGTVSLSYLKLNSASSPHKVSGQAFVGGLVGEMSGGTLSTCYVSYDVEVQGVADDVGPVIGLWDGGIIESVYFNKERICSVVDGVTTTTCNDNHDDNDGITGLTTDEMQDAANYDANWKFLENASSVDPDYKWYFTAGSLPMLHWQFGT